MARCVGSMFLYTMRESEGKIGLGKVFVLGAKPGFRSWASLAAERCVRDAVDGAATVRLEASSWGRSESARAC